MKLRILKTVDGNGDALYHVQRRWFWLFWKTTGRLIDCCAVAYDTYSSKESAKHRMNEILKSKRRGKVVQKNIVCGGDVVGGDLVVWDGKERDD